MNRKCLIVVEGKTDIDFLSKFISADFYSVNGSAVSEKDLEFIKQYMKNGDVVVLTDPDFPGTKIRNYLNENITGLDNAYVRKEFSIKKNKVGVAESTKDEVLRALKNKIKFSENKSEQTISSQDLYELGLIGKSNSSELRKIVSENFHLGFNNAKSLLKKLNMLSIEKEEIEMVLKDVK